MLSNKTIVSCLTRTFTTSNRLPSSHYDILGLTPKATQADIKSAYYKLSMLYHPDKSPDAESAKKFRAITEAYEVLGNVRLKKLYDKGLIVGHDSTAGMSNYKHEEETSDPVLRFYKSHEKRHVTPTMDGKTPIYDFEKWAKQHYGDTIKKQTYERDFVKMKERKRHAEISSGKQETLIYVTVIIVVLFGYFVIKGPSDYDRISTNTQQSPQHATGNK